MRLLFFILMLVASLFAKEQRIVFSYSTPPYVFTDGSGIVMTIVKEALAYKGHTVTPIFVNIGRSIEMFKEGYVDGSSIIQTSSGLEAFYSKPFMQYHNAAFALEKRKLALTSIDDLAHFHLIAFQNATKYLGETFEAMTHKAGKNYTEVADQKQQVYRMVKGRTDVVVMDRHIFRYYYHVLLAEKKITAQERYTLYELFPPTQYQAAFKEKAMRDDFDAGVAHLKATGRYEAIYDEYSQRYFEVAR